jgi:Tol biopolymer transport system component
VKVLDFGLAKALASDDSGSISGVMANAPTMTHLRQGYGAADASPAMSMTSAGMLMGTAAYMAPEQARGKRVDKRVDVWAFGCVLFEMLTSTRAFDDEDVSLTLSKILQRDPDFGLLPKSLPPHVRHVIELCLKKDPAQRLGDMHDVKLALAGAFTAPSAGATPTLRTSRRAWYLIAAAFLAGAVMADGLWWWFTRAPDVPPPGIIRFALTPPDGAFFPGALGMPRMAVSPNGEYLAYTLNLGDGKPDQLWVRRLDSTDPRQLTNVTDGSGEPVQYPFWSPDSKEIAFFVQDRLQKVRVEGGAPQTVCTIAGNNISGNHTGGSWSADGVIVFGSKFTKGIQRVPATGGTATQATTLDAAAKEVSHHWPRFLPDGRHFVYQAQGETVDERVLYLTSLDSANRAAILKSPFMAEVAQGHLLFVRDGSLVAQPFSTDPPFLSGAAVPLADSILSSANNGRVAFSVSQTGVLMYRPVRATGADSQLAWVDRSGRDLLTPGPPAKVRGVELSRDGRKAVVHLEEHGNNGDLWMYDLDRGSLASPSRLTFDPAAHNTMPVWTGNGRVVFTRISNWTIVDKDAAGVGGERLIYDPKGQATVAWGATPGGETLLMGTASGKFLTAPTTERTTPVPFLDVDAGYPQVSPDGRWVAYSLSIGGFPDLYVRSFPKPDTVYQVTTRGGIHPRWRGDSRELFYVTQKQGDTQYSLMALPVQPTGNGLTFGPSKTLLDGPSLVSASTYAHPGPAFAYAVHPDGERFLIARVPLDPASRTVQDLTIVINWPSALARK